MGIHYLMDIGGLGGYKYHLPEKKNYRFVHSIFSVTKSMRFFCSSFKWKRCTSEITQSFPIAESCWTARDTSSLWRWFYWTWYDNCTVFAYCKFTFILEKLIILFSLYHYLLLWVVTPTDTRPINWPDTLKKIHQTKELIH